MSAFPRSLLEFQRQFSDEAACAAYLAKQRWPEGFVCPSCGGKRGWALETKQWTTECADCGRQTSVTAGTVKHRSKLPLTVWFWAAYLMATHSDGISATQVRSQLGLGSYKTAWWLLCAKQRSAMVAPERTPLSGLVEMDETAIPFRTHDDPSAGGQGRSHQGKMLVAGAVEVTEGGPGRIRLRAIPDFSSDTLAGVVKDTVASGSTIKTDGWTGYAASADVAHDPHVVGSMAAHIVLPWVHRVYHGLRQKHLQAHLDEFVFRFNRRRTRHAAFRSLLGIATSKGPVTYETLTRIIHRRSIPGWRAWFKRLESCMNLLAHAFSMSRTELHAHHAQRYPDPTRPVTRRWPRHPRKVRRRGDVVEWRGIAVA